MLWERVPSTYITCSAASPRVYSYVCYVYIVSLFFLVLVFYLNLGSFLALLCSFVPLPPRDEYRTPRKEAEAHSFSSLTKDC